MPTPLRTVWLAVLVACTTADTDDDGPTDDTGAADTPGPTGDSAEDDGTWRSVLYPEDWTPAFTLPDGRFLHDHSYAGYHSGEAELPDALPMPRVDVTDHGADPTGQTDSADAFVAAIATLTEGGTVWIPAGTYVVGRRVDVTVGGVVIAGAGADETFVHGTQDTGQAAGSVFRFRGGAPADAAEWRLAEDGAARSLAVTVDDTTDLAVGDGVAVGWTVTPAFIADHDMTGTWTVALDQWRPFFRRTVVAIEGDVVTLDAPVRYPALTRDGASLRRDETYLTEVGIQDLALSTKVADRAAMAVDRHHALEFDRVQDGWMRRIRSYDPDDDGLHLQSGGLYVQRSRRVTVADVQLGQAQNRGGGGNGYLFEISRSGDVLIRDSVGDGGRHNFIANWDFSTNGCVFLRTVSRGGRADNGVFTVLGASEFHHSLAMANLIDQSEVHDAWHCKNRHGYSTGAGHAGTQNTFWNLTGPGELQSWQWDVGYVVGSGADTTVIVDLEAPDITFGQVGTAPEDHTEGLGEAATLVPASLYEDQLARRLGR